MEHNQRSIDSSPVAVTDLSDENFWKILNVSLEKNATLVTKMCLDKLRQNTGHFLEKHGFGNASPESMEVILKLPNLSIREVDLIEFCWTWAQSQPDKMFAMRRLLSFFRLLTLTPRQLALLPDFLTKGERLALFEHICTDGFKSNLPETISTLTLPRCLSDKLPSPISNAPTGSLLFRNSLPVKFGFGPGSPQIPH